MFGRVLFSLNCLSFSYFLHFFFLFPLTFYKPTENLEEFLVHTHIPTTWILCLTLSDIYPFLYLVYLIFWCISKEVVDVSTLLPKYFIMHIVEIQYVFVCFFLWAKIYLQWKVQILCTVWWDLTKSIVVVPESFLIPVHCYPKSYFCS